MISNESQETKTISQENIIYSIKKDNTASIIGFRSFDSQIGITIPRAIKFESNEYIIKIISSRAFYYVSSIQFVPDSELTTIEENAFSYSYIGQIFIPSSLINLKKGWCCYTEYLTKIEIDPKNPRYASCFDGKFIIGKSTINQENYDTLIFSVRNIVEAKIPSFIKIIGENAFEYCKKLQRIEFEPDSQLKIFEKQSFCFSSIKSISIPPHVTKICEYAFHSCFKLDKIDIPVNSQLQTIEKNAFSFSSIESIFIPECFIEFIEGWDIGLKKLKKIEIDPKNPRYLSCCKGKLIIGKSTQNQENYDTLVHSVKTIAKAIIPNFVKFIESKAFNKCNYLRSVVFEQNSELQIIGKRAFNNLKIESISISSHVTQICEHAFSGCKKLKRIKIPTNSELKIIEPYAFDSTYIEYLSIPSSVIELKQCWCYGMNKLTTIQVDPKNLRYKSLINKLILGQSTPINGQKYDTFVFVYRSVTKIMIPKPIRFIGSCAFNCCQQLRFVRFHTKSKLQKIEKKAFASSSIECITIPPHVTKICKSAFSDCKKIQIFEIDGKSEMKSLKKSVFVDFPKESIIMMPMTINLI